LSECPDRQTKSPWAVFLSMRRKSGHEQTGRQAGSADIGKSGGTDEPEHWLAQSP
jgi:hypothetical protein